MAINKKEEPMMVRDYWPKYRRRSLFFVVGMQIITTLVVGSALVAVGVVEIDSIAFWTTLIAALSATVGINILVFGIVTEPLQMLSSALTYVSGEKTSVITPDPTSRRYERNGLKPLLEKIYELAINEKSQDEIAASEKPEQRTTVEAGLSHSSTGVVIMDSKQKISFSNKSAPVRLDNQGELVVDLIFDNEMSLSDWLKQCEEKSVHAEKTWLRVANKIIGEENRRIFDIVASYQKGSEAEVVLTLFDRSEEYSPEDNDLDFIAFAAHELRGPITVIRGYLDSLESDLGDRLQSDEKELFNRLIVSANRLSSYVNNILNAAKHDRRHLKVHLHEESIKDIYDSISDDMRLRAAAQNRLLAVSFPDNLATVAADKAAVGEVIGNLIDNAIKYSNEGGLVNVKAAVVGNFVEVSVEDQGIGMPSNVISNLFHKFYRSHRSRETVAGTGIGLYICKALIESHGGEMSVRSVEGRGSTFSFTLAVFSTVQDKLQALGNGNDAFIRHNDGWIKNHGRYKG